MYGTTKELILKVRGRQHCISYISYILYHIVYIVSSKPDLPPAGMRCQRARRTGRTHVEPGVSADSQYWIKNIFIIIITIIIIIIIATRPIIRMTIINNKILHHCQVRWHIRCHRGVLCPSHNRLPAPGGCIPLLPIWHHDNDHESHPVPPKNQMVMYPSSPHLTSW